MSRVKIWGAEDEMRTGRVAPRGPVVGLRERVQEADVK